MKKDNDFYKRMLEAKERKKKALDQKRLHNEFGDISLPPQIVIKSASEQKMDAAFVELQAKLRAANPTPEDKIQKAFEDIARKAQGL